MLNHLLCVLGEGIVKSFSTLLDNLYMCLLHVYLQDIFKAKHLRFSNRSAQRSFTHRVNRHFCITPGNRLAY